MDLTSSFMARMAAENVCSCSGEQPGSATSHANATRSRQCLACRDGACVLDVLVGDDMARIPIRGWPAGANDFLCRRDVFDVSFSAWDEAGPYCFAAPWRLEAYRESDGSEKSGSALSRTADFAGCSNGQILCAKRRPCHGCRTGGSFACRGGAGVVSGVAIRSIAAGTIRWERAAGSFPHAR